MAIPLDNYQELFNNEQSDSEIGRSKGNDKGPSRRIAGRRRKPRKVLIKGHPGVGKTTLIKKMGWDWAKGIFTTFSILFVVFLKFAKPGEPIENIIINSLPDLEGVNLVQGRN